MRATIATIAIASVVLIGASPRVLADNGSSGIAQGRVSPSETRETPQRQSFKGFSQDLLNFPFSSTPTPGKARITIHRDDRGNVTDITVSDRASGTRVHTGSTNAASGFVSDPLGRFTFAPQGWAIASYLDFSSFGAWIAPQPDGSTAAGAVAGGIPTPLRSVPTTGTAQYTGKTFGAGVESAPLLVLPVFIFGDASIAADFGKRQVTTSLTNLRASATAVGTGFNPIGSPASLGDLTGTATLRGNTYTGTVSGTLSVLSRQLVSQGPLQGRLFGPKANETAGTWSITGSPPPGAPGEPAAITAVGSFGASRR